MGVRGMICVTASGDPLRKDLAVVGMASGKYTREREIRVTAVPGAVYVLAGIDEGDEDSTGIAAPSPKVRELPQFG